MTNGEDLGAGLGADATPTGLAWPEREVLPGHDVVLARPRLVDAATTATMQDDPRLWVDVPTAHRTTTTQAQADDFRRFLAHWRRHGFGYWLLWPAAAVASSEQVVASSRATPGVRLRPSLPVGLGGLRWLYWRDAWVLNAFIRLAVPAQGRGVAEGVLGLAIARLDAHLDRPVDVVVRTRPDNAPMIALARRLGATDAGTEEREAGTYHVLATTIGT